MTLSLWGYLPFQLYHLVLAIILVPVITIPTVTLFLAFITSIRRRFRQLPTWSSYNTALYEGRVSHTRFVPTVHAFSYPLFFCVLDLDEAKALFSPGRGALWPLSLLMQYRDTDHLKNGEGLAPKKDGDSNSTRSRLCRLIAERTREKCRPSDKQRILLITHLSYFGYCFNPVSFYYVMHEKDHDRARIGCQIDAIVAEVSNTPWEEMNCYVLHPDSVDVDRVKPGRAQHRGSTPIVNSPRVNEDMSRTTSDEGEWGSINYIFQKAFHVSPFMTMDHTYDWTFWLPREDRISVSTSMIRDGVKYFNAFFDIGKLSFTPWQLCYQLIRFPMYCVIIQIWIHIEAFWLFLKGVEFIPHPKGSETAASRIIAAAMTPLFALTDWLSQKKEEIKGD
jgi:DUF1365 family protein